MKTQRLITGLLLLVVTTSLSAPAYAIDFLATVQKYFYAPMPNQKFGIEVEMMGLHQKTVVDIVRNRFGGSPSISDEKGTIKLSGSTIGDIEIKLEVNETDDDPTKKYEFGGVIEVVTAPIDEEQVKLLDGVLAELKNAGAVGTDGVNPISIQINVGMMEGTPEQQVKLVVDIMRTYYKESHQEQIRAALNVPANRWDYLQDYSKGFMNRLFQPGYNPTAKEFYFDFIYRQSLEESLKHNKEAAWTMSEASVRTMIEKLGYPVHVKITKLNQIKVASLMLHWFPEDPYTKSILKQGWIKAAQLLEYRIFNNDFKVWPKVKQVIGIHRVAKLLGRSFDHDTYMAEKLRVTVPDIKASRSNMMCQGQF
jgi:hypothetical protein